MVACVYLVELLQIAHLETNLLNFMGPNDMAKSVCKQESLQSVVRKYTRSTTTRVIEKSIAGRDLNFSIGTQLLIFSDGIRFCYYLAF